MDATEQEFVAAVRQLDAPARGFTVVCMRVVTGTATAEERATVESVASDNDSAPNYRTAARIALGLE